MPVAKAAGKEYDRNRALAVPPYIMRLIEDTPAWKAGDGYIITASGESIRGRFRRLCAKADFAGHLQGIPKKQKSPHQGAYFIISHSVLNVLSMEAIACSNGNIGFVPDTQPTALCA